MTFFFFIQPPSFHFIFILKRKVKIAYICRFLSKIYINEFFYRFHKSDNVVSTSRKIVFHTTFFIIIYPSIHPSIYRIHSIQYRSYRIEKEDIETQVKTMYIHKNQQGATTVVIRTLMWTTRTLELLFYCVEMDWWKAKEQKKKTKANEEWEEQEAIVK